MDAIHGTSLNTQTAGSTLVILVQVRVGVVVNIDTHDLGFQITEWTGLHTTVACHAQLIINFNASSGH
jgi:hypothetical protein